MFQFTTTNVLNSPWFGNYTADSYNEEDKHSLIVVNDNILQVKGVGDFVADNITHVYKAEGYEAQKASLEIEFEGINEEPLFKDDELSKNDIFRLNVYIGLSQGSNDAMYANDTYFKGKSFMIEFRYEGDWEKTLKKLDKTIKRYQLNYDDEKMVDVEIEGTTLTLTAVNEYQRFKRFAVEKLDNRAYNGIGDWVEVDDAENYITVTEGLEGFGTYNWILHNLRIPTAARNDIFSTNAEEAPIMGAIYDQYTIHYCKHRGSLGLNAVGDQTVSHTTHVFYALKQKDCATDVSTILESAIGKVCGDAEFAADGEKLVLISRPVSDVKASGEDGAGDEDTTEKDEL